MSIWVFIIATTAISTFGWVANNWIKARHGYPIEDNPDEAPSKRRMDAICTENGQLRDQVGKLEARLAVLEQIATDPAERTAREIEKLR
jgi:hypothetical protein